MNRHFFLTSLTISALLLTGCGGGGGGDGSDSSGPLTPQPPSAHSKSFLLEQAKITDTTTEINESNAVAFSATLFDILLVTGVMQDAVNTQGGLQLNPDDLKSERITCSESGSINLDVIAEEEISITYDNCSMVFSEDSEPTLFTGIHRLYFSESTLNSVKFSQEYDFFKVVSDNDSTQLVGIVDYYIDISTEEFSHVDIDIEVSYDGDKKIKANELAIDISPDNDSDYYSTKITNILGRIWLQGEGSASVSIGDESNAIYINKDLNSYISMAIKDEGLKVHLFESSEVSSSSIFVPTWLQTTLRHKFKKAHASSPYLLVSNDNPTLLTTTTMPGEIGVIGETVSFDINEYFGDSGNNLNTYSLEFVKAEDCFSDCIWSRTDILPQDLSSYAVEQENSGEFTLASSMQNELMVYTFDVIATNTNGQTLEEKLRIEVVVELDTDNDGEPNRSDIDDDNDGVMDGFDAFPYDASESLDTDYDGIGNNKDTDDDNDGVIDVVDLAPLDKVCAAASDIRDGECIFNNLYRPDYLLDKNGVLYVWDRSNYVIERWDSNSGHFMEPLTINDGNEFASERNFDIYYAKDQHTLYINYGAYPYPSGGVITKIDLDEIPSETLFINPDSLPHSRVSIVDDTKSSIVLQDLAQAGTDGIYYYSIGDSGVTLDSYHVTYDGVYYNTYFRQSDLGTICEIGFSVDNDSGMFYDIGTGDYLDSYCSKHGQVFPGFIAPDGEHAMIRNVGIVDKDSNVVEVPNINAAYYSVYWTSHGLFYKDFHNKLWLYSEEGEVIEERQLDGDGINTEIVGLGDHFLIIKSESAYITKIEKYTPSL